MQVVISKNGSLISYENFEKAITWCVNNNVIEIKLLIDEYDKSLCKDCFNFVKKALVNRKIKIVIETHDMLDYEVFNNSLADVSYIITFRDSIYKNKNTEIENFIKESLAINSFETITWGIDITDDEEAQNHFWKLVDRYNIKNIKCSTRLRNKNKKETAVQIINNFKFFLENIHSRGLYFYNDCVSVPSCLFDKSYHRKLICHANNGVCKTCLNEDYLFIMPDLSLANCCHSLDSSLFNLDKSLYDMNKNVVPDFDERIESLYAEKCKSCTLQKQKKCYNGCLKYYFMED